MKRCLALLRVSTEEQADSGLGLQAQRQRIEAFCLSRGWELVQIYEEAGVSAGKSLKNRPVAGAMLRRARKEGLVVVVLKLDRLFRSVVDAAATIAQCNEGFSLVSVSEPFDMTNPMGRAMAQVASVFAELERAMIRDRTRAAMKVLQDRGLRRSRTAPYGTRFHNNTVVPNPEELAVIDRMKFWASQGHGYERITQLLNEAGTVTRSGKPWVRCTVRQILKRAV